MSNIYDIKILHVVYNEWAVQYCSSMHDPSSVVNREWSVCIIYIRLNVDCLAQNVVLCRIMVVSSDLALDSPVELNVDVVV